MNLERLVKNYIVNLYKLLEEYVDSDEKVVNIADIIISIAEDIKQRKGFLSPLERLDFREM